MKKIKINDVPIYIIPETKRKFSSISIYFVDHYDTKRLLQLKILLALLFKSNVKYKNEDELLYACEELYASNLYRDVNLLGEEVVFTIGINFINPSLIKDDNYFSQILEMLFNTIYNPSFTQEKLDIEKELLIKLILSNEYDKDYQINNKIMSLMYPDDYLSKKDMKAEDLAKVTLEDIRNAFNYFKSLPVFIAATGQITEDSLCQSIRSNNYLINLKGYNYSKDYKYLFYPKTPFKNVKMEIEEKNYKQSVLCIGLKTSIRINDNLRLGANMFIAMMVEYYCSTLMKKLRTDMSLVYSINFDYSFLLGYALIYVNLDANNYELALDVILGDLKNYQQGKIDKHTLKVIKTLTKTDILKSLDSEKPNTTQMYKDVMNHKYYSQEESIKKYNKVTCKEIKKAAQTYYVDTIYFLKGTNHGRSE